MNGYSISNLGLDYSALMSPYAMYNPYLNYEHLQNYHFYTRGVLAYIEAVNYLIYERPNNAQILKLARKHSANHTRILADKDTFEKAIKNNANKKCLNHILNVTEL